MRIILIIITFIYVPVAFACDSILEPAEVLAQLQDLAGKKICIRGRIKLTEGACTLLACSIMIPCCNGCAGVALIADDEYGISLYDPKDSRESIGYCYWRDCEDPRCDSLLPDSVYTISGVLTKDPGAYIDHFLENAEIIEGPSTKAVFRNFAPSAVARNDHATTGAFYDIRGRVVNVRNAEAMPAGVFINSAGRVVVHPKRSVSGSSWQKSNK